MPISGFRADIILDGAPLMLYRSGRGRAIKESSIPALAQETFSLADEPVEMETWHLGAFYSQRLIPGTYAYTTKGDGRWPRLFLPGPEMNTVTLTNGTTPRCAADYGGEIVIGAGRYVFEIKIGRAHV